jgi:hypothetical protein
MKSINLHKIKYRASNFSDLFRVISLSGESSFGSALLHESAIHELFPRELTDLLQEYFQVDAAFAQRFSDIVDRVFDSCFFGIGVD